MRIGDVLFDVSRGARALFHQEIMAVHTDTKQCYNLGDINRKSVSFCLRVVLISLRCVCVVCVWLVFAGWL
jgi:hypothetical protein